jgi:uncharacterized SAM-binding protein YcdF (DUF218 family)
MKKVLIFIVILFVVVCCAPIALIKPIGDFLMVPDELEKSDLIAAISGPEYRIVHAAELYKKGLGATLFFTGGFSEENQRFEADWSKYLSTTLGVPEEAMAVNNATVISTYEEAVLLNEYILAHPEQVRSVIIVTDYYHTRRARWIYQKVLGDDIRVLMAPVPFSQAGYSSRWWESAVTRKMVRNEWVKYIFYLLRYQASSGGFRQWLTQFDQY